MKCSKTFTLHIDPPTTPTVWWPFDYLPPPAIPPPAPPWLDSILAHPIEPSPTAGGTHTIIAGGHVAECYNMIPDPLSTTHCLEMQSYPVMHFTDGFTCAFWLRIHNMGGNDDVGPILYCYNGHVVWPAFFPNQVRFGAIWLPATNQIELGLTELGVIQIDDFLPLVLADNVWYLITYGYDRTTGRMFYSLNDNAPVFGPTSYVTVAPWTEGRFDLGMTNLNLTGCNADWDEFCYFTHVISAAEQADLWNGGAGRTWP